MPCEEINNDSSEAATCRCLSDTTAGKTSTVTRRDRQMFELDKPHTDVVVPGGTREQIKLAARALRRNMPKTEKGINIRAALEAVRRGK